MKARHIMCAAALATPLAAQAAVVGEDANFSYTYLDLGYSFVNFSTPKGTNPALGVPDHFDPGETSDSAFNVRGSVGLTPNISVRLSYLSATFENETFSGTSDWDTTEAKLGVGLNFPLADNIDFLVGLDGVRQSVDNNSGFDDDEMGYGGELGFRVAPSDWFNLTTVVGMVDVDEITNNVDGTPTAPAGFTESAGESGDFPGDSSYLRGTGHFKFTDNFGAITEAELRDEDWIWTVGLRLSM